MERAGNTLYYHQDGLGSVVALSDATGQVIERYSYDVFGKPDVLGFVSYAVVLNEKPVSGIRYGR